ncbi:protein CHUP1, chloroplastic isoform X2 [Momordica charantia]|uniref:Protein CHUP1, chloroplastic isoform X2 n=1 Tax=Momordica charantia TaxID=3673 RepID=A0A6J1C980_MOMCH|nr:protein CHUP1, chloroplastic isoform X2 [Momordica charantia]
MEQRGKSTAAGTSLLNSAMPSRGGRVSLRAMESPSPSPKPLVSASAVQSTPQSVVKKQSSRVSRSLALNAPKKGRDGENVAVSARTVNRGGLKQVSQRRSSGTGSCSKVGDCTEAKSELQEKLCFAEDLIKDLRSQLLILKEELQKSQSLNLELQSQNDLLVRDLAAAETKLANASNNDQAKNTQKLENGKLQAQPSSSCQNVRDLGCKAPPTRAAPPPPPPPLPLQSLPRAVTTQKSPDLIRLFHSLRKKEGKRDPPLLGKPAVINAHNSIVGEIQNRSSHLLAIRADIETKGEFINGLIDKVLVAAYTDIEDVLKFVDWLDSQLSSLADERAVLKHFKWPEKKADAMREAAIEYRALKLLENEISLYKDDTSTPCEAALKKMASLLDKSERGIQRLIGLRNTVMHSYQELKLPTNWMLDSGITSKIKQASINLAKMYMKRVKIELDSIRSSDKESNQESLLLQGVHFAYRTHQFAGGLDSETLCAFEEIKQWVPKQGWIVGIPSS